MIPAYNFDKIKFATDTATFEKAINLYESGKVTKFKKYLSGFSAIVKSTHLYNVDVSARHYDRGSCECYLGQTDILCKHMVAVALYAVMDGKPLLDKDKQKISTPTSSGKVGELTKEELNKYKKNVTAAMRYIKAYDMPSKYWFQYQNSLDEGVSRLSTIVSELPIGQTSAELLISTLLRLDDKLCNSSVDDSNGTVGNFIEETVRVLKNYKQSVPDIRKIFKKLEGVETCFGWEKPLLF